MNVEIKLNEMANDGLLSYERIALACLAFMSEDDIREMARVEELIDFNEDDEAKIEVIVCTNDIRTLVAAYDEMDDDDAFVFAEEYCEEHNLDVVVERVTDNGGEREELERFNMT